MRWHASALGYVHQKSELLVLDKPGFQMENHLKSRIDKRWQLTFLKYRAQAS